MEEQRIAREREAAERAEAQRVEAERATNAARVALELAARQQQEQRERETREREAREREAQERTAAEAEEGDGDDEGSDRADEERLALDLAEDARRAHEEGLRAQDAEIEADREVMEVSDDEPDAPGTTGTVFNLRGERIGVRQFALTPKVSFFRARVDPRLTVGFRV